MATALARDFHMAWPYFERARMDFADLGLSEFHHERRFGGRGHLCPVASPQEGTASSWERRWDLQDYLLGFGLRYALLSGHLAARSLVTGEPYAELVNRHLTAKLRAGAVNRLLYNHLGDRGYSLLMRWVVRYSSHAA